MQLNNLEYITNFTMAKILRIVCSMNLTRGIIIIILISIFYLIFRLFIDTFLIPFSGRSAEER
jgi:hypothetical protein